MDKALFYYKAETAGINKTSLAKALNLTPSGLYCKFARSYDFTVSQIIKYASITGCNLDDINEIFFDKKLNKTKQKAS